MAPKPIIVWFRQDLRLTDNQALAKAAEQDAPVICVYVRDDDSPGDWRMGAASRWWLHHSLQSLSRSLEARGAGPLVLMSGRGEEVVARLARETDAQAVHLSRMYEPWAIAVERRLKERIEAERPGMAVRRYAGSLLKEPEDIATQAGDPYKVYSPFWRALVASGAPRRPVKAPERIAGWSGSVRGERLGDWGLLPRAPDWAGGLRQSWTPGEEGALARLEQFLADAVEDYAETRNRPDLPGTSRLSPHLHFGEISPATVWHRTATEGTVTEKGKSKEKGRETFLKELVWREFSAHLLFHFPTLPEAPFREEFAAFPWTAEDAALSAWQKGQTGYPIVDAGMRELWTTGYMHNRVRMIVASFLIKDLLIHWRAGEDWFWDTLVDADLANNAASWQWVAGSGADAAPYFRIFNPVSQGRKFDPDGIYVRRWVPEIANLPDTLIHAPWEADRAQLEKAGVRLGETYPMPMVDHARQRVLALAGYEAVKKA